MIPDKTIAQKLLIKEGYKILIAGAPPGYTSSVGDFPLEVKRLDKSEADTDLIQVFLKSRKELEAQLPLLKKALKPGGLLWVTYPKGTSKIPADINRDSINAYAKTLGMIGIAMISVDETWSALRLKFA